MLRTALTRSADVDGQGFRIRSRDVSRLEGLSDAVFGFAITLLVVSLEVPKTFDDLAHSMRGFVAFGACFAMLIMIWHQHYTFFRRYALEDFRIIVLNAMLLFVVVFYIYPLKFMFTAVIGNLLRLGDPATRIPLRWQDGPMLMTIYSVSIVAVFGLIAAMYLHAYRKRRDLGLSAFEVARTRMRLYSHAIWIALAVLSILIANIGGPRWVAIAGCVYALLGPAQWMNGVLMGRRAEAARDRDAMRGHEADVERETALA